jgi:RecJ-like exonuclease
MVNKSVVIDDKQISISHEFRDKLEQAISIVTNTPDIIRVVTHYDADGIAAGAVLVTALRRKAQRFHLSFLRDLNSETIIKLKSEKYKLILFSDMGSGYLDVLENNLQDTTMIVFDHHQLEGDSDKLIHLNCNKFGINGTFEAAASAITFLFAIMLDDHNWDLAGLALAGSIGDKQHLGGFRGLNKQILAASIARGYIEEKTCLKLSGNTVNSAIEYSVNPYFKGITGNRQKVTELLTKLGIDGDKAPRELSERESQLLSSLLILNLLRAGVRPEFAEEVVCKRYLWVADKLKFIRDLEEFSYYINACGRLNRMGVGLTACLVGGASLQDAGVIRDEYRQKIYEAMVTIERENRIKSMNHIQFLYLDEPLYAGTIVGLGMQYIFDPEKPTIGVTPTKDEVKISARGTRYLVDNGLNLADACKDCAKAVGGYGGGHPIASGATIPKGKDIEFLERIDRYVGAQLYGAK